MIIHQEDILCMDPLPLHDYLSHWPLMAARVKYSQSLVNKSKKERSRPSNTGICTTSWQTQRFCPEL